MTSTSERSRRLALQTVASPMAAAAFVAAPLAAQDYHVIVNAANATTERTVDQASKVFLTVAPKFPAPSATSVPVRHSPA